MLTPFLEKETETGKEHKNTEYSEAEVPALPAWENSKGSEGIFSWYKNPICLERDLVKMLGEGSAHHNHHQTHKNMSQDRD